MYSIGEKIKELRKEHNMTQAQLADKLGVSYQAVSKWENGTSSPDISLIPNITKAFSISADVLFDLVDPEVKKEEIYADYKNILNHTNSYVSARNLLEKAIADFPKEYLFYIMLGATAYNCAIDKKLKFDDSEIQYAISCYDKVINECEDNELIDFAKIGKYVIYEELNEELIESFSTKELIRFVKKYPDFMKTINPNWKE